MFNRKNKEQLPSEEEMKRHLKRSEDQKEESGKELINANNWASVLHKIREENHIILDLKEVFGGH